MKEHKVYIRRLGSNRKSLFMTIPKECCEKFGWSSGDYIRITEFENTKLLAMEKIK